MNVLFEVQIFELRLTSLGLVKLWFKPSYQF